MKNKALEQLMSEVKKRKAQALDRDIFGKCVVIIENVYELERIITGNIPDFEVEAKTIWLSKQYINSMYSASPHERITTVRYRHLQLAEKEAYSDSGLDGYRTSHNMSLVYNEQKVFSATKYPVDSERLDINAYIPGEWEKIFAEMLKSSNDLRSIQGAKEQRRYKAREKLEAQKRERRTLKDLKAKFGL